MRFRRRIGGLFASLIVSANLAACSQHDASDPMADLDRFEIGAEPVVILREDGTPEKEFTNVNARRLETGDIVVADASSSSLHLFARDGTLRSTLARRGAGPGELDGLFGLTSFADTIFALGRPPMSRKGVVVFAAGSGYLRSFIPATDDAPLITVLDRLSTGQFVARRGMAGRAFNELPPPGTMIRDSVVFGVFEPPSGMGKGTATWLPPVQTQSFYVYEASLGRLTSSLAAYTLGGTTMMVASGDRMWLIDGGSGELRAYDAGGREVVARRLSITPKPYDDAALDRARARALGSAARAQDTARLEALYDRTLLPPAMPLVSSARAGADGEIWLRLFDVEVVHPQRFLVVDRDGNEIATATMPPGFDVQHIGAGFVLGTRRDSLDVLSVVEYPVRR